MCSQIKLSLTPSRIGEYYRTFCGRHFVYESLGKEWQDKLAVKETVKHETGSAQIDAGNKWEKMVLEELLREQEKGECIVLYKKENDKEEYSKYNFEETIEVISDLVKGEKTDKDGALAFIYDHPGKPVYIYQAHVKATEKFEDKYITKISDSEIKDAAFSVGFSDRMYPDLIEAVYDEKVKKVKLTVIDIKSAAQLKESAEIQIALYALLLESMIDEAGIEGSYVNQETGIVWNKEKITNKRIERKFGLEEAYREITYFFDKILPDLNEQMRKNTAHNSVVSDKLIKKIACRPCERNCVDCPLFMMCESDAKREKSVRLLPYITQGAHERLNELIKGGQLKNDKINSVFKLLENGEDAKLLTDGCTYWKNVKYDLEAYKEAFCIYQQSDIENKRFAKGTSTTGIAKEKTFALFLTAEKDAETNRMYAYGWHLECAKEINLTGKANVQKEGVIVAENKSDGEFDRLDGKFVQKIAGLLDMIGECQDATLQMYVMDYYEKNNICDALYYILERNEKLREKNEEALKTYDNALKILFWLADERLAVVSNRLPEVVHPNAMCVLTAEVKKLYVLPACIAYDIRDIMTAFGKVYDYNKTYFSPKSNQVKGEVFNKISDGSGEKKQLINVIDKKLGAEQIIAQEIIKDSAVFLSELVAPKYVEKAEKEAEKDAEIKDPRIAPMIYQNRYEDMLDYQRIRNVRMRGLDAAINEGKILHLKYVGETQDKNQGKDKYKFEILDGESWNGEMWFAAGFVEYDKDGLGLRAMRCLDEKQNNKYAVGCDSNTKRQYEPKNNEENSESVDMLYINKDLFSAEGSNPGFRPTPGTEYLVFEVHKNPNLSKTEKGIRKIKDREELLNPANLAQDAEEDYDDKGLNQIQSLYREEGNQFSDSQKNAFRHLCSRKLTVLVGPPASGKTEFIGRAVVFLAGYYKKYKSRNLKILVSAMSHSAIENMLLKIAKIADCCDGIDISVSKADRFDDEDACKSVRIKRVVSCKPDQKNNEAHGTSRETEDNDVLMSGVLEEDTPSVIGMTGWAVYNYFYENGPCYIGKTPSFDLIIIDEASQVRAIDAFLQLSCSGENTRFLLVGDGDQLPPIIQGDYDVPRGKVNTFDSVFTMYLSALQQSVPERGEDGKKEHKDIVHLQDNYRMNGILCRYSAKQIYGPQYKAANDTVKNQKLNLKHHVPRKKNDDIIDYILDKDYPLVFCKLSGDKLNQREAEVRLVANIVKRLWDRVQIPEEEKLSIFWDEYCGIISPYHEQISRLKRYISSKLYKSDDNIESDGNVEGKSWRERASEIYIGTVDKLQGKERQTVIVSYGVSDPEKMMTESEFIFSRNRFNVSLTRGKAKTIVILSDTLVTPDIHTNVLRFKNEEVGKGIEFIHGFADYMKNEEEGELVSSSNEKKYRYSVKKDESDHSIPIEITRKKLGSKTIIPHAALHTDLKNDPRYYDEFYRYFWKRIGKERHPSRIEAGVIIDELIHGERDKVWIINALQDVNKPKILVLARNDQFNKWKKFLAEIFKIQVFDALDEKMVYSFNAGVLLCMVENIERNQRALLAQIKPRFDLAILDQTGGTYSGVECILGNAESVIECRATSERENIIDEKVESNFSRSDFYMRAFGRNETDEDLVETEIQDMLDEMLRCFGRHFSQNDDGTYTIDISGMKEKFVKRIAELNLFLYFRDMEKLKGMEKHDEMFGIFGGVFDISDMYKDELTVTKEQLSIISAFNKVMCSMEGEVNGK